MILLYVALVYGSLSLLLTVAAIYTELANTKGDRDGVDVGFILFIFFLGPITLPIVLPICFGEWLRRQRNKSKVQ